MSNAFKFHNWTAEKIRRCRQFGREKKLAKLACIPLCVCTWGNKRGQSGEGLFTARPRRPVRPHVRPRQIKMQPLAAARSGLRLMANTGAAAAEFSTKPVGRKGPRRWQATAPLSVSLLSSLNKKKKKRFPQTSFHHSVAFFSHCQSCHFLHPYFYFFPPCPCVTLSPRCAPLGRPAWKTPSQQLLQIWMSGSCRCVSKFVHGHRGWGGERGGIRS